ncbi:zinc-dependent alcohol dehydrogenase [Micromonospora echinofusca]|uniref:Zinc-binding dehydrogenase n=1 Tax=Micromonospora echinofusca TaxID=47858 RepID=A0ABS3W1J6_MICEH|nr:zinc-binding dehydrogenase [Micromonospora echinofusca]MBO4210650.1 zinc-binding dehydrogenase [Micromonospora echinofusca]
MIATSRAAVVTGPGGPVEIREYPVPAPGPGEAVVRVELCGICGTDAHVFHGRLPSIVFPALLGHEVVGTVVALGAGLDRDFAHRPVAVGDRIGIFPATSCGACYECVVLRRPGQCRQRPPSYGFKSPVEVGSPLTGGFADYLHLANPGTVFYRTDLAPEVAILAEPMSVALHGVHRAGIGIGATVVVQGVGAIGLMVVAAARTAGAARVVAVDGNARRLALAAELGADRVVDVSALDAGVPRHRAVRDALDGSGASAVIGCSGSPAGFAEAIGYVADGGVLAELGNFTDRGSIPINPYTDLLRRDITIAGVYGAGPDMQARYLRALEILERGDLPFARVVSHRVPLRDVEPALRALSTGYQLDGSDVVKIAIDPSR